MCTHTLSHNINILFTFLMKLMKVQACLLNKYSLNYISKYLSLYCLEINFFYMHLCISAFSLSPLRLQSDYSQTTVSDFHLNDSILKYRLMCFEHES